MTTADLIALLRETDPSGSQEVWLEITNGQRASDYRCFTDPAESVRIDWAGDLVISAEEA